ncbi:hypothetical protein PoMZ_09297 [Pyricularia oryzae]|uniref:Secreted protein n=1 Tax=Pyricularia oryzae TaxID=318829 RepID=A0A4P7MTU8_PYROR|nr:hypothetical protein PoMZ_09297 [Pyricularia oryzae]
MTTLLVILLFRIQALRVFAPYNPCKPAFLGYSYVYNRVRAIPTAPGCSFARFGPLIKRGGTACSTWWCRDPECMQCMQGCYPSLVDKKEFPGVLQPSPNVECLRASTCPTVTTVDKFFVTPTMYKL